MKKSKLGLAAILMLAAAIAGAHTNEYLDTLSAPHGGQLRMSGPYHFELVMEQDCPGTDGAAKERDIIVYVTDHGDVKIPTAKGEAKATLISGKQKVEVKLQPDGDNRFKGVAKYRADPKLNVAVFVKLPDQQAEAARFAPFKKKAKAKAADGAGKQPHH